MNRIYLSLFIFFAVVAGCGDNAPTDADESHCNGTCAVVVAPGMGGQAGILSKLDVDGLTVQPNLAAGVVGGDPILRRIGHTLYIINRDVNNVTMVDARTLELLDQVQIGDNSNPQDVAVVGDKLYVPALGTAGVVVVTPGGGAPTTINLNPALGNDDGKPDCVSAYAIGNDVYVACGLLANFNPTGNGKIAVIDAATDTVRTTIDMPVKNPQSLFVRSPLTSDFAGDLFIPTFELTPDFALTTNGCVVRVTPGQSPSASCAIQNADINGAAMHIDVLDGPAPLLALAVTSDFADGRLLVFDLQTMQLWNQPISAPTQVISDVAACPNGKIIAADETGDGGLRVLTPSDGELTTSALPFGLPPGFGNDLVCYTR